VVQRKMAEAGRGLNLSKCRILIHPDSADLVVSTGMKLLGASIVGAHLWKLAYARSLPLCRAWRSWRSEPPGVCCNIVLMNA
jgi:hypothetical protein